MALTETEAYSINTTKHNQVHLFVLQTNKILITDQLSKIFAKNAPHGRTKREDTKTGYTTKATRESGLNSVNQLHEMIPAETSFKQSSHSDQEL